MASSPPQQHLWSDLHREILLKISKYLDSPLDVLRFRAVCRPWRSSSSQQHLWSDLHLDILLKISKYLDSPLGVLRFRAVCRPWRSSVPLRPQNPPLLKLPFPITSDPSPPPDCRGHFLLTESTVYAIQPLTEVSNPTKTWVIKTQPSKSSGCMVLENPLGTYFNRDSSPFGDEVTEFFPEALNRPFRDELTKFLPEGLNLLDYKVTEISKAYSLQFVRKGKGKPPGVYASEMQWTTVKQVAVSSKLHKIDGDFAVMALQIGGGLSVWRMSDKKWVSVARGYSTIAYHNGKFYAVDNFGVVISVDPVSLKIAHVCPDLPCFNHRIRRGDWDCYLVESFGDWLLVEKFDPDVDDVECDPDVDEEYVCPVIMKVYKLNEGKQEWCHVGDGLKGRSLFVCEDHSFSLLSKDFTGCVANCIYFSHDAGGDGEVDDHPGWDAYLFDVEKDAVRPSSAVPKIFWPPPTWLEKNPSLEAISNSLTKALLSS